jgi:hypothetical protein
VTRVTEAWLFSRVLSGMNAGESEKKITSVTLHGVTSALLDPSRPTSISSRHLSDRSRLRSAGRALYAVSPVPVRQSGTSQVLP